jgi:hypothetical protein
MKEAGKCSNGDGRPATKRGMCNACYLRYVRSTPPAERPSRNRPTEVERFFSFANKMGPIARNNPELGRCWVWTGGATRGYGIFWADGRSQRAHVWSYKHFVGPVPDDMPLDHFACDRTLCVNYDHVHPATHQVNVLRSGGLGAQNAQKTHCPKNHEFDEANTRINSAGSRVCLTCVREADRELKRTQRAEISGRICIEPDAERCRNGHEITPEGTFTFLRLPSCRACAIAEGVKRAIPRGVAVST